MFLRKEWVSIFSSLKSRIGTVFSPHVSYVTVFNLVQNFLRIVFVEIRFPLSPRDRIERFGRQNFNSETIFRIHFSEIFDLAKPLEDSGHEFRSVCSPIVSVEIRWKFSDEFLQNRMAQLKAHHTCGWNIYTFEKFLLWNIIFNIRIVKK